MQIGLGAHIRTSFPGPFKHVKSHSFLGVGMVPGNGVGICGTRFPVTLRTDDTMFQLDGPFCCREHSKVRHFTLRLRSEHCIWLIVSEKVQILHTGEPRRIESRAACAQVRERLSQHCKMLCVICGERGICMIGSFKPCLRPPRSLTPLDAILLWKYMQNLNVNENGLY